MFIVESITWQMRSREVGDPLGHLHGHTLATQLAESAGYHPPTARDVDSSAENSGVPLGPWVPHLHVCEVVLQPHHLPTHEARQRLVEGHDVR